MEKKLEFSVICSDEKHLIEAVDLYNSHYKTDFLIVRIVHEVEVIFVDVEVTKFKIEDIFKLGYAFGVEQQKLRQQGKIDW